ncbi:MAG: glycosyltransferase [Candidatus Sumerlaeia bacterium]|nr:glycosyltransferase [Candidatus Sumerlaeia bacterium]
MNDLLTQILPLALLAVLLPMAIFRPVKALTAHWAGDDPRRKETAHSLASSLSLLGSFLCLIGLLRGIYPELPALPLATILVLATALGMLETLKALPSQFPLANRLLLGTLCYLAGFGFHPSATLEGWSPILGPLLIDYPVTLLFYMGMMASINVLDRLHGLATGSTMILALALMGLVVNWAADNSPLFLGVIGAVCLGHLLLVQGDKRLKLGNAGQLQLGILLATATVISRSWGFTLTLIIFPLIALMLPIFDRVYDGLWRLSRGPHKQPPTHLRSLLLDLGLTERWLVFFIWLVLLQAGVLANLIYEIRSIWFAVIVGVSEPLIGLFLIFCLARIGDKMERKRDPRKLRILFLSHYFHPEVNAPATRLFEHTRQWTAAGHEVTVICPTPSAPHGRPYTGFFNSIWSEENVEGARVIRVWTFIAANKGRVRRTINYLSFMISSNFALIFLRRHDVLVATTPQFFCGLGGAIGSLIRREKFILEVRDIWPESIEAVGASRKGWLLGLVSMMARWMYRRADAIVTVGEGYRDKLLEITDVPAGSITVIPNGVAPEMLNHQPKPPPMEGPFIVSYVGTLGMAHGLDVVLSAAEKLRDRDDIQFVLAGDGAEYSRLSKQCDQRGLRNVTFTGLLEKESALKVIESSSACLVHLKNRALFRTVLPSKLFEAMAMARPVLLGVEGHSKKIVLNAGAGLCFPPEDADGLSRAILELADNRERGREMGACGRDFVANHYTRESFAVAYLETFREVCTRKGNAPPPSSQDNMPPLDEAAMESPHC